MKKFIAIILSAFYVISLVIPSLADNIEFTDNTTSINDQPVNDYYSALSSDSFRGNGVIYVTIHHDMSDVGKVYTEAYFPELDIEKIEDITGVNLSDKKEDYSENFKNVLKITLIDKSRENVISAIFALQNRAAIDIYWAEPAYFTKLLDVEDDSVTNEQSNIVNDTNEYWKEIIQYYQAISYLEDNGVDLSKSDGLGIALADSYIIKNHSDLNVGDMYYLVNEFGYTAARVNNHATMCAGVLDNVCDNVEFVSIALPPLNQIPFDTEIFDAVEYISSLINCLNNSEKNIEIVSVSSVPHLDRFYNTTTCVSILDEKRVTKIYVPETVESIGPNAFSTCANLTDIYIYSEDTELGSNCLPPYNRDSITIHCYMPSPAFLYATGNGYSYNLL